jgi:uncharacterized membrane protein YgdD (TMEM256/DUF423 family)
MGAFGAHALKSHLTPERLEVWKTATHYHLLHAVAVALLGATIATTLPGAETSLKLLTAGLVVFSGTLYLLCLTGVGWLGAITPIGGLLMIAGWLTLAWAAWQQSPRG